MQQPTFLKLGGSIITDKQTPDTANEPVLAQLAAEIGAACQAQPDAPLLVGHGSGSFGHVAAAQYGVHTGLADDADWRGFALTARAALRLNRLVLDALLAAGVPALTVQPSAGLLAAGGEIQSWATSTVAHALARRLVPIIHGDVAFDTVQHSAIISTEALFAYLAHQPTTTPTRIILVGETAVYTDDPFSNPDAQLVPLVTAANIDAVLPQAGASRALDVTGGMRSKVALMWKLVQALPGLHIHLIDARPGALHTLLVDDQNTTGTCIRQEA